MNKRQRKKWLKQHNLYVNPRDTWTLDTTIAEFVLPRLKLFKKVNNGYPGIDEMDTPEKWDEALDKMIIAFQYVLDGYFWWIDDSEYDYSSGLHIRSESAKIIIDEEDWVEPIRDRREKETLRRQKVIDEGMQLFAKWYQHLWW